MEAMNDTTELVGAVTICTADERTMDLTGIVNDMGTNGKAVGIDVIERSIGRNPRGVTTELTISAQRTIVVLIVMRDKSIPTGIMTRSHGVVILSANTDRERTTIGEVIAKMMIIIIKGKETVSRRAKIAIVVIAANGIMGKEMIVSAEIENMTGTKLATSGNAAVAAPEAAAKRVIRICPTQSID